MANYYQTLYFLPFLYCLNCNETDPTINKHCNPETVKKEICTAAPKKDSLEAKSLMLNQNRSIEEISKLLENQK